MCSHRVGSNPVHFWPVTEWRNVALPSVLPPLMRGLPLIKLTGLVCPSEERPCLSRHTVRPILAARSRTDLWTAASLSLASKWRCGMSEGMFCQAATPEGSFFVDSTSCPDTSAILKKLGKSCHRTGGLTPEILATS